MMRQGRLFDKAAKMLGFPYPGDSLIDKHAKLGDPLKFEFSEPRIQGLNYSFSGLKTSIKYYLEKRVKENPGFIDENLNDLCASVQHVIVKILLNKVKRASGETHISEIAIAGGVSANSGLREALTQMAVKEQWRIYIPKFEYCTDNAAMIAITGKFMFENNQFSDQMRLLPPLGK